MKQIIKTAKKHYFNLKLKIIGNDFINDGVRGDFKKVQHYIDNGGNVDVCNESQMTLLHYLSFGQDIGMKDPFFSDRKIENQLKTKKLHLSLQFNTPDKNVQSTQKIKI